MGGSGKQSFLPPKSPFLGSSHCNNDNYGSKTPPKPREGNNHHHRTSSASFLVEEQPSWLDDLLDEPDTPAKRGFHRRSSSDSCAYADFSGLRLEPTQEQLERRSSREIIMIQDVERSDGSTANNLQTEIDPKRVKQKFAQRSRVRKLQYIAELERTVQALQGELTEISSELGFLDRQNIILNLENEALRRRLDSLAKEKLLKCVQQETLEREIARLHSMYHQHHRHHQQPKPQANHAPAYGQNSVRDLDSLFCSLSLKQRSPIIDGNQ